MLQLIKDDGWLAPYEQDINNRHQRYRDLKQSIESNHSSLFEFASAHEYFGIHYDNEKGGWWYREWAPAAQALSLIGEFNNWNDNTHQLNHNEKGVWEIFINDGDKTLIPQGSKVKVRVTSNNGTQDRIPAYILRTIQDEDSKAFDGQAWDIEGFNWTDENWDTGSVTSPLIYECHVGMSLEKEAVGTYNEFRTEILPRIQKLGYNCIQLMAVQEHPYYGSFGYHVSSFFAASSRFGTPDELMQLVDDAHNMGIAVIMDIVHSHAVKNTAEGLNQFDGSNDQYFHPGERGEHPQWDSKCFNYGKQGVQQFLLSNIRFWMEKYHFDGFRFDGVTSMLYHHHGTIAFDHYDNYFKDGTEWDAISYLQLANDLIHSINPHALSIAEDMSGMPGLCYPIQDGGIGFDYRLGMGIPDNWIKILKHQSDENWNLDEIWGFLSNRRYKEKTVAYAESHDQALVGDKSLAFWLMDQEMYWHMKANDENIVIDRGIALHKMIRLITISLGGESYLNFIGNEFGHPEWVDFPREGNNWSHKHCKRQWHLVDDESLKYKYLNDFDAAMIKCVKENKVLEADRANKINVDDLNKTLIFERNNLLFVFNFHTHNAIPDYKFFVPNAGKYEVILNSDDTQFGGHGRVDNDYILSSFKEDGVDKISIYNTNRTALVLKLIE